MAGRLEAGRVDHQPAVRYSAGAMLLDPEDVTRVVARVGAFRLTMATLART